MRALHVPMRLLGRSARGRSLGQPGVEELDRRLSSCWTSDRSWWRWRLHVMLLNWLLRQARCQRHRLSRRAVCAIVRQLDQDCGIYRHFPASKSLISRWQRSAMKSSSSRTFGILQLLVRIDRGELHRRRRRVGHDDLQPPVADERLDLEARLVDDAAARQRPAGQHVAVVGIERPVHLELGRARAASSASRNARACRDSAASGSRACRRSGPAASVGSPRASR